MKNKKKLWALTTLLGVGQVFAQTPASTSMLVLDASGSMWGQIGGQSKMQLAVNAVDNMLKTWPPNQKLGLIAYGHRQKGDCKDIQVLRPANDFNANAIRQQVKALNPKGMTPISDAVVMAAKQLRHTEQKATVILISDGEETCNVDPCAVAKQLEQQGIDFTTHVIGFDLPQGKARSQLQCIAKNTGGKYLEARNAAELNKALGQIQQQTVKPVPVKGANEWMPDTNLWPETSQMIANYGTEGVEHLDMKVGQTAKQCQTICYANKNCGAWVYEPAGSYFVNHPRCSLKSRNFAMRIEKTAKGDGWVSGVRPDVKIIVDE